jgi:vitamin B12 transporter
LRFGKGFWGATRLKASYGKGIKEPEMLPVGCSPTLDPERSTTINAGIDQFFASDRVHFSAYYFHNDFRDIVSFAAGGETQNCPAYGGNFFNTDLARAYGASSTFEIKATRWARIVGNYTYDDSRVLKAPNATDPALVPGNRLFQRPLHSANLVANAHFGRMNWNLAGYYVGRRTDSDFDGLGITSDPSYVRWDLANSILLGHGLSTEARVENLFDKKYQLAVGYPGLRLNYLVGLRYRWGGE